MRYADLSRTISHALRHEPWLYGLELDEEGWVSADVLLASVRKLSPAWHALTEHDLTEMIKTSSKQRFEMADGRIRSLYGHSTPERVRKIRTAPPARLFHGTSQASVPLIRENGLKPMGRQYVHLSTDRETAIAVGKRKSVKPAVLTIKAQEAYSAGVAFFQGNDKVWLADYIPAKFIVSCSSSAKMRLL